jgi:hypothetical protein
MKKGRLHVRLPEELREQIDAYARKRRTTVSALVQQHFLSLLEAEQQTPYDAEQI